MSFYIRLLLYTVKHPPNHLPFMYEETNNICNIVPSFINQFLWLLSLTFDNLYTVKYMYFILDPNVLLFLRRSLSDHYSLKCISCSEGMETHRSVDAWLTFSTVSVVVEVNWIHNHNIYGPRHCLKTTCIFVLR